MTKTKDDDDDLKIDDYVILKNDTDNDTVIDNAVPREPDKVDEEQPINLSKIKENWAIYLSIPGTPVPSWPEDVIMFTPVKNHQMILPDYANCLTVKTYLKMCNLKFQIEERENAEFMSPTLNVPFIKVDNVIVSELDGIINFLNNRNIKLTDKLDKEQKINLKAYMSLISNVVHLCELFVSWVDKETYEVITRPKYSSVYPWPLNRLQTSSKRNQVLKKLETHYWSQKSLSDVLLEFENCCEAINDRLEGKTKFFEGQDTELDAAIFGHIYAILSTTLPGNHLENIVKKFPDLLNFVEKMKERFIE